MCYISLRCLYPICSMCLYLLWVTSFHHHIRGTIPHKYLSTPLQESSDVIISGLRSELSSLNQKLEEMTSYHQVTLSTMGRARSYWMAWVLPVGGGRGRGRSYIMLASPNSMVYNWCRICCARHCQYKFELQLIT